MVSLIGSALARLSDFLNIRTCTLHIFSYVTLILLRFLHAAVLDFIWLMWWSFFQHAITEHPRSTRNCPQLQTYREEGDGLNSFQISPFITDAIAFKHLISVPSTSWCRVTSFLFCILYVWNSGVLMHRTGCRSFRRAERAKEEGNYSE